VCRRRIARWLYEQRPMAIMHDSYKGLYSKFLVKHPELQAFVSNDLQEARPVLPPQGETRGLSVQEPYFKVFDCVRGEGTHDYDFCEWMDYSITVFNSGYSANAAAV
jgi:hypothetical protein